MKKILLLPVLLLLAITSFAKSENAELFTSDETEFNVAFAELNTIENYVNANAGITAAEINAPLNVNSDLLSGMANAANYGPLGIPSFLWGCVAGVAGVAVVYFVADDRDETKKALWGCVANAVVFTVLYITVFAVAATTTTTYSY